MNSKGKVLVIDDDADFRASVRSVLEEVGYVMLEAGSGEEGLEALQMHEPDVIVLDIMMTTLEDGYGVNQAIKFQEAFQRYRGIPIIMVSSIQQTPDERFPRAEEVGMIRPDWYMTKPLDLPRFLETVARAMERSRSG